MNYRNAALAEITALAKETENYMDGKEQMSFSVGQVILSIIKEKPEGESLNEWLNNISDEDMYTLIESTKLKQRP